MLPTERSIWSIRAERLLEQALGEVTDHVDAMATVSAALTALEIEAGMQPADTMDGYRFPGEADDESECICPSNLRARGGFKSGCPVHG